MAPWAYAQYAKKPWAPRHLAISFRYELQDGGRALRAAEQVRGGSRDQDNLSVFDRS